MVFCIYIISMYLFIAQFEVLWDFFGEAANNNNNLYHCRGATNVEKY